MAAPATSSKPAEGSREPTVLLEGCCRKDYDLELLRIRKDPAELSLFRIPLNPHFRRTLQILKASSIVPEKSGFQ